MERKDEYFTIYSDPDSQFLVCQATEDYAPIEDFKKTFEFMVPIVEKGGIGKIIFDKRSLRVFHQPSMDWYYTAWKLQLLALGLSVHRKILPDLPYFAKAVEAGKQDIAKNHPDFPFDKIDVQYFDLIEDCIAN
ncbi:MAG: hypothetical protein ABR574_04240 [Cryomorphaceae bacterium]|nr:hypothetical protein [Flavobacteriales bacterium]